MINSQNEMNALDAELNEFLDEFPGIEEVGPEVHITPLSFVAMAAKIAILAGELEPFVQWIGGYAEARAAALEALNRQIEAKQAH